MEKQLVIFFAQIQKIDDSSDLFETFKKEGLYFYYFQSKQLFYIFWLLN